MARWRNRNALDVEEGHLRQREGIRRAGRAHCRTRSIWAERPASSGWPTRHAGTGESSLTKIKYERRNLWPIGCRRLFSVFGYARNRRTRRRADPSGLSDELPEIHQALTEALPETGTPEGRSSGASPKRRSAGDSRKTGTGWSVGQVRPAGQCHHQRGGSPFFRRPPSGTCRHSNSETKWPILTTPPRRRNH